MVMMKKNNWLDEFQIDYESQSNYQEHLNDYDIFKDKKLLDKFRDTIIQELIDNQIPDDKLLTQYINEEIDIITEGYDLSNVERNHLFNLIEKASPVSCVTGSTRLNYLNQKRVVVAVAVYLDHLLQMPRGCALVPKLLS